MSALTRNDFVTVAKMPEVSSLAASKPVLTLSQAPSGYEGEGFPVKRAFAGIDLSLLDPFIMMDEMGEVNYAPGEPKGTSWHPHRGFSTFTYLMEGVFDHKDSHGGGGTIRDGATQWMTAGSGILHIEAPPEWLVQKGGLFHGLQLWINLPKKDKMTMPAYQDITAHSVKALESKDGGSLVRLISGRLGDQEGPGQNATPITFIHATVEPGHRLEVPWDPAHNTLAYLMEGEAVIGKQNVKVKAGEAIVLGAGDFVAVEASKKQNTLMPKLEIVLLGGKPIGEPIAWAGPFVMNHRHEVLAAYEDFQHGRFGQPQE